MASFYIYNKQMENDTPKNPESETEFGPLTGTIIIFLLILAGGWYFLNQRIDKLEEQRLELAKILEANATTTINLGTSTIKN